MTTLRDVLAPIDIELFTKQYLGKQWLHVRQPAARLAALVSLADVSDQISRLRVSGGRVRVTKEGQLVPASQYLDDRQSAIGARIDVRGLRRQARAGATLVVDFVDELLPSVWTFADDCEAALGLPVQVNLYVSWGQEPGFDLHWDDHDVLVLQIAGEKRWTVYQPTLLHPVRHYVEVQAESPTAPPVFEGALEAGDVLYLPRGWWHVARATHPPSVHLTVGFTSQTGVDFLRWASSEAYRQTVGRQDVPIHASAAEQAAWIEQLRAHLSATLAQPEILASFQRSWLKRSRRREAVQLDIDMSKKDDAVAANGREESRGTSVRLLEPMSLTSGTDEHAHQLTVRCGDILWHCAPALNEALRQLSTTAFCQLDTLTHGLDHADRVQLQLLLDTLAMCGAADVRDSSRAADALHPSHA